MDFFPVRFSILTKQNTSVLTSIKDILTLEQFIGQPLIQNRNHGLAVHCNIEMFPRVHQLINSTREIILKSKSPHTVLCCYSRHHTLFGAIKIPTQVIDHIPASCEQNGLRILHFHIMISKAQYIVRLGDVQMLLTAFKSAIGSWFAIIYETQNNRSMVTLHTIHKLLV